MSTRWNLADLEKKPPAIQAQVKAELWGKRMFWTNEELNAVRDAYASPGGVDLVVLGAKMGRTHAAIACKANELGICVARGRQIRTELARQTISAAQTKRANEPAAIAAASVNMTEWHKHNAHPRGMLGKKQSLEFCRKQSERMTGFKQSDDQIQKRLKTNLAKYGSVVPLQQRHGASWICSWVEIGGQRFFARSRWEANYGRYLEWLRLAGEIQSWEHEPKTFWFEGIKRGCVSYLPDFRVIQKSGSEEYHEVKGWMDARSITKIARMAKYFPDVRLVVIDSKRYRVLAKQFKNIVPLWDSAAKKKSGRNSASS